VKACMQAGQASGGKPNDHSLTGDMHVGKEECSACS
jgi:hypothetical protein